MELGMLPLMPVFDSPLQSHSTLSHVSSYHSFTQALRCSQEDQCGEVANGARDAPTDACVEQRPAEPQHTQPHQQPTLIHTTQCTAHRYVSALRLPMVLGMLPLMPMFCSALQSHSTLSHVSNRHSFTHRSALLTVVSVH